MPAFYKGYGVVFSDSVKIPFKLDSISSQASLTMQEVEEAESILNDQYNGFLDKLGVEQKYTKKLKFFYRQYFSFINLKGEKKVIVSLLYFKNKRRARRNFTGWDKEIFFGFGEFYEKNMRIYKVNLQKKKLEKC